LERRFRRFGVAGQSVFADAGDRASASCRHTEFLRRAGFGGGCYARNAAVRRAGDLNPR
jgi:hypothetical protein